MKRRRLEHEYNDDGGPGDVSQLPTRFQKHPSQSPASPSSSGARSPTIFNIFDRQLNLDAKPVDMSLYSRTRSWVRDTPLAQLAYVPLPKPKPREGIPPPLPPTEAAQAKMINRNTQQGIVNILSDIPAATLLQSHLIYLKKVRTWHKTKKAIHHLRYKDRLQATGLKFELPLQRYLEAKGSEPSKEKAAQTQQIDTPASPSRSKEEVSPSRSKEKLPKDHSISANEKT